MATSVHIAEVQVRYVGESQFDGLAEVRIRAFLEREGCQIYSSTNDGDAGAFNWEIDKSDLLTVVGRWNEVTWECVDYSKDELKRFLSDLTNSNGDSNICHVHWF